MGINIKSTLMFLVVAGVFIAYSGPTGLYVMDYPLWKFLLGLGLGAWVLYNIPNIARQF